MTPEDAAAYPEHAKLEALDGKNEVIGQFLEWLNDTQHVALCRWEEGEDGLWGVNEGFYPVRHSIQEWIALYFGIDNDAFSREKEAMIAQLRDAHTRVMHDKVAALNGQHKEES